MEKLELGKTIKIGQYNCVPKKTNNAFYHLSNNDSYNENIFSQFGINRLELNHDSDNRNGFPEQKTMESLQKVYEYIMSKDPANKQEDKFIVGKWYKFKQNSYGKFECIHNSGKKIKFSETVTDKIYDSRTISLDLID